MKPRPVVHHGDCLDVLREMPDASVHAVVTDPPYGLANTTPQQVADTLVRWVNGDRDYIPSGAGFMGKAWDAFVPPVAVWDECLRVLKPGGHLLAFAGSRTFDLMGLGIRLAGFDIRDGISWLYGSGFPKSLDVSKAIDRARDDRDEILALTTALADLAAAAGITRGQVDECMGTSDMGGWWLSRLRHRCACPSVENWTRLRDVIPGAPALDDLVWRLNGRKGSPGEAWERREVTAQGRSGAATVAFTRAEAGAYDVTAPATPAAEKWQGWGTALKPAFEPVVVARKPLAGTVAGNVLAHGTGALNIDACRVATDEDTRRNAVGGENGLGKTGTFRIRERRADEMPRRDGRWPANVALDESQAAALDQQSGVSRSASGGIAGWQDKYVGGTYAPVDRTGYDDEGGASRFFPTFRGNPYAEPVTHADDCHYEDEPCSEWCAYEGGRERSQMRSTPPFPTFRYEPKAPTDERPRINGVAHATVKPLDLMRWLVRLVTPPGGNVLDPFAVTGTTLEAAMLEGFASIGIERDDDHLPLIRQRLDRHLNPAAYLRNKAPAGEEPDLGLFGLLDGEETA